MKRAAGLWPDTVRVGRFMNESRLDILADRLVMQLKATDNTIQWEDLCKKAISDAIVQAYRPNDIYGHDLPDQGTIGIDLAEKLTLSIPGNQDVEWQDMTGPVQDGADQSDQAEQDETASDAQTDATASATEGQTAQAPTSEPASEPAAYIPGPPTQTVDQGGIKPEDTSDTQPGEPGDRGEGELNPAASEPAPTSEPKQASQQSSEKPKGKRGPKK